MTEYGIFDDEGMLEGGFYDLEKATRTCERLYAEDGAWVAEVCPDHSEQPKEGCEQCSEGEEGDECPDCESLIAGVWRTGCCDECGGSGRTDEDEGCLNCDGTGSPRCCACEGTHVI